MSKQKVRTESKQANERQRARQATKTMVNVQTEVAEARLRTLSALRVAVKEKELRQTATALGRALQDAAEDDVLWKNIADLTHSSHQLELREEVRLGMVVQVDWTGLLNELGYEPQAGEADLQGELVMTMDKLVQGEPAADPEIVRAKLRKLADRLQQHGADATSPAPRLRPLLRRAVSVASIVVLAIGIIGSGAVAGSAIVPALTPLVGGAAASAGAVMVGGAVLHLAEKMLDSVLHRTSGADSLKERDVADGAVRTALVRLHSDAFTEIVAQWDHVGSAQERDVLATSTRDSVVRRARLLYRAWDAAADAEWTNGAFNALCRTMAADLHTADDLLSSGASPAEMSSILARIDKAAEAMVAYSAIGSPIHSS